MLKAGMERVVSVGRALIAGKPYYHMWFLTMLIGIYLLAPIVIRFMDSISYKNFRRVAFCFLVMAILSRWTSSISNAWDIGQSFEYLGYFMIGYVIRRDFKVKNNNIAGAALIALGVIAEICAGIMLYQNQVLAGQFDFDQVVAPYNPVIVIASLLVFAGFSMLQIKRSRLVEKISKRTFIIYLFHAGVWYVIANVVIVWRGEECWMRINPVYGVPIFTFATFVVSYVCTVVYEKCWKLVRW